MEFDNETIRIAVRIYLQNGEEGIKRYGHINTWNVSNVTNMNHMFVNAILFNEPLDNWNVSNVTNMDTMFHCALSFNQPLNNWNVRNVTHMTNMFDRAIAFNQPLDNWNVSNVTDMNEMFQNASSFNQPLDNWDVSGVTNMRQMFKNTSSFNQLIDNLFYKHHSIHPTKSFNEPLSNWNISNVTNTSEMFDNTTIGEMLKKHNLTDKQFFESPINKPVYHDLFVWPRKKDYIMFLVNNHYLPFNNHNGEHEYHCIFDNTDISKHIATYI